MENAHIKGIKMTTTEGKTQENIGNVTEMLSESGYAEEAISYFLKKENMGSLPNADQVTELTGPCGDTMKIFMNIDKKNIIQDAKIQVLGCPCAIASAMAAMDLIRGKSIDDVTGIKDRDIFKMLVDIPDQKQHCIQITSRTIQKAIEEYKEKFNRKAEGV